MKVISPSKIIFFFLNSINQLKSLPIEYIDRTWEPKIHHKQDPDGNFYFQVYDPVTRKSSCFTSELEVRIWLKERYYQSGK